MKLFRFSSTAANKKNSDIICNIAEWEFQGLRFFFDEKYQCYVIELHTNKSEIIELHEDINFAKERAAIILIELGADAALATELCHQARFLIK